MASLQVFYASEKRKSLTWTRLIGGWVYHELFSRELQIEWWGAQSRGRDPLSDSVLTVWYSGHPYCPWHNRISSAPNRRNCWPINLNAEPKRVLLSSPAHPFSTYKGHSLSALVGLGEGHISPTGLLNFLYTIAPCGYRTPTSPNS